MTEATATKASRRADAQRNYDRLLVVAREAVAARGADIVLEDIARDAGVGIGTLYRHFPTRQDLLEATFLDEAVELREYAEKLAHEADALGALVSWLRQQIDFGAHGRSMGSAVMNAKHTEGSEINSACVAMRESGDVLLKRAQAAGVVREEVNLLDVLRLIHAIVIANEQSPDPDQVQRMLDLVIAGMLT
ncbi:MAG TPA: helix-turn-helix domain-containing protein [Acidimicrobiales bacterium]